MKNELRVPEWWMQQNLKNNRERCVVNASDSICEVERETEKAMLLNFTSELFHKQVKFWIPKSLINSETYIELDKNKISKAFFLREMFDTYESNVLNKDEYKCYILKETDKALFVKFVRQSKEKSVANQSDDRITFYFVKWVDKKYIVNEIEIENIKYREVKRDDNNIYYISEELNEDVLKNIASEEYLENNQIKFNDTDDSTWETSYLRNVLNTTFKEKYLNNISLTDEVRLMTIDEACNLDVTDYNVDGERSEFWLMDKVNEKEVKTIRYQKKASEYSHLRVYISLKSGVKHE